MLCCLLRVWQTSATAILLIPRGIQGVLPCSSGMVKVGAHNTVDAQRHVGEPYHVCHGVGVDGAHNTVGKISTPTTLLGFWHAWKVAGHLSDMSYRLLSCRCAGYGPWYCGQLESPSLLAPSVSWSSLRWRPRSVGPSQLQLRQSEKSCKQEFGTSPIGDVGWSW